MNNSSHGNAPDRFTSPMNFVEAVRSTLSLAPKILIHDCTLRDGEGQPGVSFTFDEKVEIARLLDGLGVAELESGRMTEDGADDEILSRILGMGLTCAITAVCPSRADMIDRAADLGVHGIGLTFQNSIPKVAANRSWSAEREIARAIDLCGRAKARGLRVALSSSDSLRTDLSFLLRFFREVVEAGVADRVRITDSCGSAAPPAIRYLVGQVRRTVPTMPVEIHCHNDHGLAVANTLAGAEAGASVLSTSMNGLGERSGNASTEEVVASLAFLYGVDLGMDVTRLAGLSGYVEQVSGVTLQPHKAIVGANSFALETDGMVEDLLKDPLMHQALTPGCVGQTQRVILGVKSGPTAIRYGLRQAGLEASAETIGQLVSQVRALAVQQKGSVSDGQFLEMARALIQE